MFLALSRQLDFIQPRLVPDTLLQGVGGRLMRRDDIHAPCNDFDQE